MLTMCNDDMPQHGLADMEGAQVTFLQSVLLAEAFPTLSKKVANYFVCDTVHLPRSGAIYCSLERDCAGSLEPN